jgi:hypothetical protein
MPAPSDQSIWAGFDVRGGVRAGTPSRTRVAQAKAQLLSIVPSAKIAYVITCDRLVSQVPDRFAHLEGSTTDPRVSILGLFRPDPETLHEVASELQDDEYVVLYKIRTSVAIALNDRFGWEPCVQTSGAGQFAKDFLSAGFDIVDIDGLTSGLWGCGLSGPVFGNLIKIYRQHLNKYGLFDVEDVARLFADARGIEVPEHAPFTCVEHFILKQEGFRAT